MSVVPYHQPAPQTFVWSLPAALQLIIERRNVHNTFCTSRNHTAAWNQVANNIFMATGFVCTTDQCRNKWNALKGDMKTWLDSMQKTHKIYLWLVQITSIKHVLRKCLMNFGGQEVINFKFGFVLLVFKQFYLHYLYLSISQ